MRNISWRGTALATSLLLAVALALPSGASSPPVEPRPITTIAVVGDTAINPLHAEFRTRDGRTPAYPTGMPAPVVVPFPTSTDFDTAMEELASGPLGQPAPGQLYALSGTRLLLYGGSGLVDVLAAGATRLHGTATASAAAGLTVGTSPDSLIVHVPENDAASFGWLARQGWIDLATTSVYSVRPSSPCAGAAEVRHLHRDGGMLLSSSGNTADAYEPLSDPNGLPEVFQVGGVDGSGRSWFPGHLDEPSPYWAFGTVVRPYEVGARFSFPAADGDSFSGSQPFGGTSGATPTVAGYAAELIAEARRILGHVGTRSAAALGVRRNGAALPTSGPLVDGTFTRDELVEVLHRTATPFEAANPGRYAIEGYGASDARSHALALRVLRGDTALPVRADEDQAHAAAEQARKVQASRC